LGLIGKDNLDKDDIWCTGSVNDVKTTVLVRHLGGGKLKVMDDRSVGNLIGKILDALDIYHCRV
jgi:hypothetical protein